MNFVSHLKAAAALGALAVMMPAPASAQALAPAVGKPLQAAAPALRARNTAAALTQVNIARNAARPYWRAARRSSSPPARRRASSLRSIIRPACTTRRSPPRSGPAAPTWAR